MRNVPRCKCQDRKHTLVKVTEFIRQHDLGHAWNLADWIIRHRFPATKCGKFWYVNSEQEAEKWLRRYKTRRLSTEW